LGHDRGDRVLVEAAAREDLHVVQPGLVQHGPRLRREVDEIARIQADPRTLKASPSSRASAMTWRTPWSVS
jgi:hypothetical protein